MWICLRIDDDKLFLGFVRKKRRFVAGEGKEITSVQVVIAFEHCELHRRIPWVLLFWANLFLSAIRKQCIISHWTLSCAYEHTLIAMVMSFQPLKVRRSKKKKQNIDSNDLVALLQRAEVYVENKLCFALLLSVFISILRCIACHTVLSWTWNRSWHGYIGIVLVWRRTEALDRIDDGSIDISINLNSFHDLQANKNWYRGNRKQRKKVEALINRSIDRSIERNKQSIETMRWRTIFIL